MKKLILALLCFCLLCCGPAFADINGQTGATVNGVPDATVNGTVQGASFPSPGAVEYWLCETATTNGQSAAVSLTSCTNPATISAGGVSGNGLYVGARYASVCATFPHNLSSFNGGTVSLYTKITTDGGAATVFEIIASPYGIRIANSGVGATSLYFRIGSSNVLIDPGVVWRDGNWHLLSVTWDVSTHTRSITVDGVKATNTTTFTIPTGLSTSISIGGLNANAWFDNIQILP